MKINTIIGIALILSIGWHHAYLARVEAEQPLRELQERVIELQIREQELTDSAMEAALNPDLSWYEAQIEQQKVEARKKAAILTAYSCEGIMDEAMKLMNCPNGITASGTVPVSGRTLACEPRLLGKTVKIFFENGKTLTGECEDTGGAITGNRFDVYVDSIPDALAFGVQRAEYVVD